MKVTRVLCYSALLLVALPAAPQQPARQTPKEHTTRTRVVLLGTGTPVRAIVDDNRCRRSGTRTYKTRTGVLSFLNGWIDALRWQRLSEMDRLGEFLFKHIEGIAAYCDRPVRFGVVESINTTIKALKALAMGPPIHKVLVKVGNFSQNP